MAVKPRIRPRPQIVTPRSVMGELSGIEPGRDITRPWLGPLLYPQDRILMTKGGGSWDIYRPIVTDDQVKSTLTQRFAAVISREWEVVPGDDSRRAQKAADWLREQLDGIGWDRVTEKMLWGVFYGYSVAELMFARDGGTWGWDDIRVRDRTRFRFDRECGLRLLTQSRMIDGEPMPEEKFWVFRTGADHDDEPYGLGLAHWLYWPVWFKRNGVRLWLIALDKFGMPTAVGKWPAGVSEEDKETLMNAVNAIRSEAGVTIPEGMSLELLTASGGASNLDYARLHETMNAAISKVVLSQTMTTDDGSSRSQSETHADVRDFVAKSDADLVCGSFNRGPVEWLCARNFPGVAPPMVWRKMEDEADLDALSERDGRLHAIGWERTPDSMRETYGDGYVRRAAPEPAPPEPAPPAAPGGDGGDPPAGDAEDDAEDGDGEADAEDAPGFAEGDGGDAISRLVDRTVTSDRMTAALDVLFGDIAGALEAGGSLEEMRDRLAGLGDGDAQPLTDLLGGAMAVSRAVGELGGELEGVE